MTVSSVLELVSRMRRDAFSRNRHFEAFERLDGDASRARRIWRYLRSLEEDLAQVGPRKGVGVQFAVETRDEGGRRITIEVPEVRLRRVAILSAEEYKLLREHPDVRAMLDTAEGRRV